MGSRFGPQGRAGGFSLGFLLILNAIGSGCINREGEALPPGLMTFPIAIELSVPPSDTEPPAHVFVANANFALQFNSGSVQSYDLEVLNDGIDSTGPFVGDGCSGAGFLEICLQRAANPGVLESCIPERGGTQTSDCSCNPDASPVCIPCACDPQAVLPELRCDPVPPDRCSVIPEQLQLRDRGSLLKTVVAPGLLISEAQIGSFSDGIGISTEGNRLYIPVRSNANLTFIDVNAEGQLDCGGGFDAQFQSCSEFFRDGSAEQVNPAAPADLPPDPVDVFVGSLAEDFADNPNDPAFQGDYILVAHREGEASMFFDQERDGVMRPRIAASLDGLAPEQVTITYEPDAKKAWISSALSNAVARVGIAIDGDPTQSTLFNAGTLFVTGLDTGQSMRDIQFDPRDGVGLAYLLSRLPESLVVARRDVAGDQLNVVEQVSVCRGPSRLKLVELPARGSTVLTAFVSCFDQRMVQIIDVELVQGVTILTNISGSFEFVVDVARERIYIADFSTSVLRIADLGPLLSCLEAPGTGGSEADVECSPQLLGLVGLPQPVSEFPR